jgi:hypothetical protein
VTPIQRSACLALKGVSFGLVSGGQHLFARSMVRRGECPGWALIELSPKQLTRLAQTVRKFRRQIRNPDLQFWAQRVLADASFLSFSFKETYP